MTQGTTRLTRKGQITVPVEVRRALNLREGDELTVETEEREGELRLLVRRKRFIADALYGSVKPEQGMDTGPADLTELRRRAWEEMAQRKGNEPG